MPPCLQQVRAFVLFFILLAGLFAQPAQPAAAAPAAPIVQVLSQPDGYTFQAVAWGDEWLNGLETQDGYTIQLDDASGQWVYAQPDSPAQMAASPGGGDTTTASASPANSPASRLLVVGRDDPSGLPRHLRPASSAGLRATSPLDPPAEGFSRAGAGPAAGLDSASAGTAIQPFAQNQGSQPILVLLVSFADRKPTFPVSDFSQRFFGAANSVRAYYQQASYGKLDLRPAAETYGTANDGMVGWLTLPYNHPSNANQSPKIVNDALLAADPYVNFAAYDTDRNGAISSRELHVMVVVAGYEQSFGNAPKPNIWAHRWALNAGGYNPVLDGVRIGQSTMEGGYAVFGEIHAYLSGTTIVRPHPATIGIIAHELGHDLDWPDLYDTSNKSNGVGSWSIMGAGSWNTTRAGEDLYGDTPALPDAFLKWYQGWLTPTQVTSGAYPLADSASSPSALLIGNNPNGVDWDFQTRSGTGEYWLVENRNRTGFDAALAGCGILVWHIDETVTYTNAANANPDRPLVELIQADGRRDLYHKANTGDDSDPFPGSKANPYLTGGTNPALKPYTGGDNGQSLGVMSPGCASSMTVYYNNPTVVRVDLKYRVYLPSLVK